MFGSLKLKHKIFAGFISVGLVATAIAVFSYGTFNLVSTNFRIFVNSSNSAQLGLLLARDVSEIQRQALIYTYEAHGSAAEQVHELYRGMSDTLQKSSEHESEYIKKIRAHLKAYMSTFEQLQKQKQLQHRLVYNDIRTSASDAEKHLRSYIKLISNHEDHTSLLQDERILNTLLLVEKNAMRYFDSLDPQYIGEAKENLAEVRKRLQKIEANDTSKAAMDHIRPAMKEVVEYERVFLEAVARTRGYLFLVNVVMAAEAYEVLYNAKLMSAQISQEMGEIEQGTFSMLQQVIGTLVVAIGISLLLVVILSLLIGRSITNPIVSLTTAFRALSKGSHHAEIPVYEADDEIGHLTRAASVFKEKNRQTEQLLDHKKQLAKELEGNKKELERSNDELEQFVYTVSHDLKSPLVTSMGFIGIIQKLAAQGKLEEAVEKLDRVVKSNERMGQLINDLLDLSRVGRVDMDKIDIDLNELLASFHEVHSQQIEKAEFTMQIEPGLPVIYANESRILQLFENMLSNALKYAYNPAGSVLSIGSKEHDDAYLVWFRDNGPGIPEEYHEKIFGLFYRLDPETEGTGIGLAVAAKVMKFHNGKIWVESSPGEGATFWLSFSKNEEDSE